MLSTDNLSVDEEEIIGKCNGHSHRKNPSLGSHHGLHQTLKRDDDVADPPKYTMPKVGINAQAAYQLLHDETALDGNPLLNIAS